MSESRAIVASPFQRVALYIVRLYEQVWILRLLRDAENLLCQFPRCLVLSPHGMIVHHATESGNDMLPCAYLLT